MLWSVVCLNGIAGVSVLSTGKDIMMDIFGNAPASVRTPIPSLSSASCRGREDYCLFVLDLLVCTFLVEKLLEHAIGWAGWDR